MTDIAFHVNVPNRLEYTCRLLRKAASNGAKVAVTGSADTLDQLNAELWIFSPTDFVSHSDFSAGGSVLARSQVVLIPSLKDSPFWDILVNLGEFVPEGFNQFRRVIEVVDFDELDKKQSRKRWKHYADAGFNLSLYDIQKVKE